MSPALYLIPVELGDTSQERVLPSYNREVILGIRYFIVEELRSARRFLKRVDKDINIDALTFFPMGKHADAALFERYLKPLETGESVGVISEAGCPAVADPGADVVAIAQRKGLRVVPLVGPSSMIMAVMASGLNGQSFAFNGYIPVKPDERKSALKALEKRSFHQTQILIETPYRNDSLLKDMLTTLSPSTRLCIAANITCPDQFIRTLTVAQWKKLQGFTIGKRPCVFLIQAQ